MPYGTVDMGLLVATASGGFTPLALALFNFTLVLWPYYLLSTATVSGGNVAFLWRKTVPLVALVLTVVTHGHTDFPAPSMIIRLTKWTIRYLVVDAVMDIVAIRNELKATNVMGIAIKAAGLALWSWFFMVESPGLSACFPLQYSQFAWCTFILSLAVEVNPFFVYLRFFLKSVLVVCGGGGAAASAAASPGVTQRLSVSS
jgi:hypothetical protein